MTSSDRRLEWVDAAKGIAILLVVAHHAVMFLEAAGHAPGPVVAVNTALASLRMPLFFLASGLFAAGPLAAPWRTLLHRRVAFFLYLFALWTLLRFAFFSVVPQTVNPDETSSLAVLALALVVPGPGMWFLYALAVFSVLGKLMRRAPLWLQLGGSALLSAIVGAEILVFDSFAWTFMARYLFFFLLGCHARALVERLAEASTLLRTGAAAVVCAAAAGAAVALDARSIPGVAFLLNVLAVAFGVVLAAAVVRFRVARPLVTLGQQTLPVYLIHVLWLGAIAAYLQTVELPLPVEYAAPALLAVLTTALSLLTHRVLVKAGGTWLFELPPRLAYRRPGTEGSSSVGASNR